MGGKILKTNATHKGLISKLYKQLIQYKKKKKKMGRSSKQTFLQRGKIKLN